MNELLQKLIEAKDKKDFAKQLTNEQIDSILIGLDDDELIEILEDEYFSRDENNIEKQIDKMTEEKFKFDPKTWLLKNEYKMGVRDIVKYCISNDIDIDEVDIEPNDEIKAMYVAYSEHGYKPFEEYNLPKGSKSGQID